jgi:hypothetical protein
MAWRACVLLRLVAALLAALPAAGTVTTSSNSTGYDAGLQAHFHNVPST